jgi:hypothetical protein
MRSVCFVLGLILRIKGWGQLKVARGRKARSEGRAKRNFFVCEELAKRVRSKQKSFKPGWLTFRGGWVNKKKLLSEQDASEGR